MEHQAIEALRERHAAWRLLRAGNAALVLSFLGRHFVEENNGATSAAVLSAALDDQLYALNTDQEQPRYPKAPTDYLDDWSADTAVHGRGAATLAGIDHRNGRQHRGTARLPRVP